MTKLPIIKINHTAFVAPSLAVATRVIEILSKLEPVEFHHDADYSNPHYLRIPEDARTYSHELEVEVELKCPVETVAEFKKRMKTKALPENSTMQKSLPA